MSPGIIRRQDCSFIQVGCHITESRYFSSVLTANQQYQTVLSEWCDNQRVPLVDLTVCQAYLLLSLPKPMGSRLILIKGTAGLARVSPATTISLPVYRVDRDEGLDQFRRAGVRISHVI
jgi:hypothetical protein